MAKVSKDDPFPGLPRRSFFGDADGDRKEGRPDPKSGMVEAPAQQPVEPVLTQASPSGATSAPRKRGRPALGCRPWEADGMTRSAWYRRQKAKKDKSKG